MSTLLVADVLEQPVEETSPPSAPPAERLRELAARIRPEWAALVFLMTTWIVVFGRLAVQRQERYGSFSLDMAIFDQATWLISKADGLFMSIRGLHFFGHHANLGLFLLAPFYWLGAGANFLNLTMVVSMALGAVPVFLLARDRLKGEWLGVALAAAYLLHPSLQFMAWELFHPETMAILPLLFGWWLARRERWGWFAVCMVYAVCWKEDVALATMVIGLVLVARHKYTPGLLTAGLSLAWFLIVNKLMLPELSGAGQAFYNNLFGTLGNGPTQVLVNSVKHPTEVTRRLTAPDARTYYWQMTAPFAFIPLAGPAALAIGLPQALVNVLTIAGFTRVITYHYAAIPLAALTLAAVEGVAFLGRGRVKWRTILVAAILACSVAGSIMWGPSPIGAEYRNGWWPPAEARNVAKAEVIRLLSGRDHISATYNLAPHLAHRRNIYSYPNPFISDNWAVNGENLPDPNVVQWLALDRQLLEARNSALFDRLVSDGEFNIEWERDDIVLARRVTPGPRVDPESFGTPY